MGRIDQRRGELGGVIEDAERQREQGVNVRRAFLGNGLVHAGDRRRSRSRCQISCGSTSLLSFPPFDRKP